MPAYYWIKLWLDLIDDYRMASLPDHLWRRAIEAFLLARTGGGDGNLPPIGEVAWKLRVSPDELEADLAELERITRRDGRVGIIQKREDGWFVTNFAKRQANVSDRERQRRKRQRDRGASRGGNVPVTFRDPDADADADADEQTAEAQQTAEPSVDAAVGHELLLEFDIGEPNATKYADRPLAHIQGWIADARAKGKNLTNPPGYVIGQLKAGLPPPERKPEYYRFIEGDYAEFIEH